MEGRLPPVSVAVIGAPGHGKSAFLNGLANQRSAFKTGGGKESCTKEVSSKSFDLNGLNVTLTDTMGFPDPDTSRAEEYYNKVVTACNAPLNAIVWLMKMEREIQQLLDMYSVLLREFANAVPPIIIVVNGMQNYEDEEERNESKKGHLQDGYDFGLSVAKQVGITCAKVIVGAEKADLKGKIRSELAVTLAGTVPRPSNIKTFAQLGDELSSCTSAEAQAARAKRHEEEMLQKVEADTASKEQLILDLDGKKHETKQVYYRDWYKLWLGGHYETEYVHDRAQVQREIDAAKIQRAELQRQLSVKEMSAAEQRRIFDQRVKKTQMAKKAFDELNKALHASKVKN